LSQGLFGLECHGRNLRKRLLKVFASVLNLTIWWVFHALHDGTGLPGQINDGWLELAKAGGSFRGMGREPMADYAVKQ
jgi:hypothetical protein